MRQVMKIVIAATTAALTLTACSSGGTTPAATGAASSPAAAALKVGMAYDVGGRGDQSFNDSAAAGLDKAAAEFGVETTEVEATNGEAESAREERLNQLVDAGYTTSSPSASPTPTSVGKVAAEYPDVKFAIVDDASPAEPPTTSRTSPSPRTRAPSWSAPPPR